MAQLPPADDEPPQGVSFEYLVELQRAYAGIPELVLRDLEEFIRPNDLSFVIDDPNGRKSAFNEGERAVWLRILHRRGPQLQRWIDIADERRRVPVITNREDDPHA